MKRRRRECGDREPEMAPDSASCSRKLCTSCRRRQSTKRLKGCVKDIEKLCLWSSVLTVPLDEVRLCHSKELPFLR